MLLKFMSSYKDNIANEVINSLCENDVEILTSICSA